MFLYRNLVLSSSKHIPGRYPSPEKRLVSLRALSGLTILMMPPSRMFCSRAVRPLVQAQSAKSMVNATLRSLYRVASSQLALELSLNSLFVARILQEMLHKCSRVLLQVREANRELKLYQLSGD